MLKSKFSISKEYASVSFNNKDAEITRRNRWDGSPHYGLFHRTLNYLASLGFEIGKDPSIEKDYKCLSKDHRYGKKGYLEFKAERYPAGFKIQFYQNVMHENPHGGEYDFDKFGKMPYLIKKQFIVTCNKLRQFFLDLGYEDISKLEVKTSEDKVKHDFVKCCHHPQKDMRFSLSDYDGSTSTCGDQRYYDRDGKLLHNGEIKYFRDYNGYLCRGKIYHRLNMTFWIIINDTETTIRSDCGLFDLTGNEPRHRVARENIPVSYMEKIEFLNSLTTKELDREIKKRRKISK